MARLILPVAGAVVGSFFGPVGAQVGFALGSIGNALLFPVKQSDPKPLDTKWTGIEYGTPIPWFIGQMRLSAIPVYLSEKSYVAQTADAGKGGDEVTTGYEYYADVMFLIADNESAALLDVIKAGRRAWTARSDASAAQLEASASTDDWEEIRFYGGDDDQLPDPDYEADVGVGFAPAYIGRTSVFIKRLRLDSAAQLPQLHFVPATDADAGASDEVILFRFDDDESEVGGRAVTETGTPAYGSVTTVFNGAGAFEGEEYVTAGVTMGSPGALPITMECWFRQSASMNSTDINVFMELQPALGGSNYLRLGWRINGFQFISDTGEGIEYLYSEESAPINVPLFVRACFDPADGQMWLFVGPAGGTAVLVANDVIPTLIGGAAPGAHVVRVGQKTLPNNGTAICYIDDARVTIGRLRSTASFSVPTAPLPYDPLATVTPNELDLADVVTELHARAGHAASLIDVSDLVGTEVHGVIAGQVQPVRGVLQQLAQGYYFERVASGGVMKYVDRGGAAVVTIPFGDMGVGEDSADSEPLKIERGSDLEVPNSWTVEFVSRRGRRYETGSQHSSRIATEAAGAQKVSLGIAFRETQGRGRAQSFALDAAVARTTFEFSVGLAYAYLEPTDVVTLTARSGTTFRARILEVSEARGILQCKAVLDDPYALRAEGAAAGDDEAVQDIALPADASVLLIDGPLLRDADDGPGFYAAITFTGLSATLYGSTDDVSYTAIGSVTRSATTGTCTALGDWTGGWTWDEVNTVTVTLAAGSAALSSSTHAAMYADASINVALIGAQGSPELIRFRTATLIAPRTYLLSGLLRGLQGTEFAIATHAEGDAFVLVADSGLLRVSQLAAEIGVLRYFKAVANGRSVSSVAGQAFTCDSECLKPRAVVDIRVVDGVLTWDRRTRLSAPPTGEPPLGEASESYDVELLDGSDVVLVSDTVTEPQWTMQALVLTQTGNLAEPGHTFKVIGSEVVSISDPLPNSLLATRRFVRHNAAGGVVAYSDSLGHEVTQWVNNGDDLYAVTQTFGAAHPNPYTSSRIVRYARTSIGAAAATNTAGVPGDYQGVAFDGTDIWVSERDSGNLRRLNASTLASAASYAVAGPGPLVYAGGDLLTVCIDSSELVRWDIGTTAELYREPCIDNPVDLLVTGSLVFVLGYGELGVYNLADGSEVATYTSAEYGRYARPGRSLAVIGGNLIVIGAHALSRFDASTGDFVDRLALDDYADEVWSVSELDGELCLCIEPVIAGASSLVVRRYEFDSTALTAAKARVYQNSAVVGRGHVAELTL